MLRNEICFFSRSVHTVRWSNRRESKRLIQWQKDYLYYSSPLSNIRGMILNEKVKSYKLLENLVCVMLTKLNELLLTLFTLEDYLILPFRFPYTIFPRM